MMQLPSSTVHPYVHRARSALGVLLPPQASGPTFWTAMKAHEKGIPLRIFALVGEDTFRNKAERSLRGL